MRSSADSSVREPLITKLFFPDACWYPGIISGALFLYFQKEKISLPLHPSVSRGLTGADPTEFFDFTRQRAPRWSDKFSAFERIWRQYRGSLGSTYKTLEPLRGSAFNTILLSYPRNKIAWQAAEDLIASSELSFSKISQLIDPYSAADELFSHIFFETFLELYGSPSGCGVTDFRQAKSEQPRQVDWLALYEYVDRIFS